MTEPIGRAAARGALITGGAQGLRAALAIATTVIVARIVSPDDYGVMAMAAPVLAFALLFQDLGLSAATIQADEISERQSSTLFWVNLMISFGIAILMLAAAPAVAWFYGDPRVGYVTAALAAVVLVTSTALQHGALLNREMRFGAMAAVAIAGAVAGFTVTVAAALLLQNYWALLIGILATAVIQLVVTWGVKRWVPALHVSVRETRQLLGFGGSVAGFGIFNFFSRNADDILIGKVWGAGPLGLYDRSYRLMLAPLQMVNAPLSKVMLPVLSRLRDEPERYRHSYLFAVRALLLFVGPAAAVAIALNDELILLLLGPQWRDAAPIFFWLAIAALYQPLSNSTGWLFLSTGRAREYFQWGVVSSLSTVLAILISVYWGPVAVAMAYVVVGIARFPFLLLWSANIAPVRFSDFIVVIWPFLIVVGLLAVAQQLLGNSDSLVVDVLGYTCVSYILAVALTALQPSGRAFLKRSIGYLRGKE